MSQTVQIRYVGPDAEGVILDDHDIDFVCLPGEPFDVSAELAERCLEQPTNWAIVESAPVAVKALKAKVDLPATSIAPDSTPAAPQE